MKVFLDDVRFGNKYDLGDRWYEWIVVRTVENCITLLDAGVVTELSLDYSLSDTDPNHTGEDVLIYILEKIERGNFEPPYVLIHSTHDKASRMLELVKEIKRNTVTLVDIKVDRCSIPPYLRKG